MRKSLNQLTEIFDEKQLDKKRINIISVGLLKKTIEFLKPWTFVMKLVQSSQAPSIHTVTPSISVINASLENKSNDPKQDKSNYPNYLLYLSEVVCFQVFISFDKEPIKF